MKVFLTMLGAVVALLALVAIVGSLLPRAHTARRSIVLRQTPEAVWAAISDFAAQPSWRTDVTRVELVGGGPDGAVWREAGRNTLSYRTTEWRPPARLVRSIADTNLAFGGRWVYELEAVGNGTRLTITEEGEVYNPIFRFIGHMFLNQAATIESYLVALARHFGERASLDP
ncbi:MAG: hypothetical protein MNPFHGCM_02300 [Gemmatimonadaceae bacterium]|nr:hypothetical protein [Gemmatimonadaceae bacterium]